MDVKYAKMPLNGGAGYNPITEKVKMNIESCSGDNKRVNDHE